MSDALSSLQLIVGIPEEWEHFKQRHRRFLERFQNLESALNIAFTREITASKPLERIIYFTGRLCAEEFNEIYLLCGNGYGVAALKLVRGMFERTVTARYLSTHPEEAQNFLDFHWIWQRKLMRAIDETFGPELLAQEKRSEVEQEFQNIRERFTVTDCEKCGTTRTNYTWSKLDLVSMAKKAGPVGRLILPGYYFPTKEAHSTIDAIFTRLDPERKGLVFDGGPQRKRADDAMLTAHNLILDNLDLQKEYFGLTSLEEPLQKCLADFMDIWAPSAATA
jgi:Family of unknown function (DUF5677)